MYLSQAVLQLFGNFEMILERSISEIREDNKEILEEEKKKHKEEAEQLQRKLYDEKESLEVRYT